MPNIPLRFAMFYQRPKILDISRQHLIKRTELLIQLATTIPGSKHFGLLSKCITDLSLLNLASTLDGIQINKKPLPKSSFVHQMQSIALTTATHNTSMGLQQILTDHEKTLRIFPSKAIEKLKIALDNTASSCQSNSEVSEIKALDPYDLTPDLSASDINAKLPEKSPVRFNKPLRFTAFYQRPQVQERFRKNMVQLAELWILSAPPKPDDDFFHSLCNQLISIISLDVASTTSEIKSGDKKTYRWNMQRIREMVDYDQHHILSGYQRLSEMLISNTRTLTGFSLTAISALDALRADFRSRQISSRLPAHNKVEEITVTDVKAQDSEYFSDDTDVKAQDSGYFTSDDTDVKAQDSEYFSDDTDVKAQDSGYFTSDDTDVKAQDSGYFTSNTQDETSVINNQTESDCLTARSSLRC